MNSVSLKNLFITVLMIGCTLPISANWQELLQQGTTLTAQGVKEAAQAAGKEVAARAQELKTLLAASKDKAARQAMFLAKKIADNAQNIKNSAAAQTMLNALDKAKTFVQNNQELCASILFASSVAVIGYCSVQEHKRNCEAKGRAAFFIMQEAANIHDLLFCNADQYSIQEAIRRLRSIRINQQFDDIIELRDHFVEEANNASSCFEPCRCGALRPLATTIKKLVKIVNENNPKLSPQVNPILHYEA